MLRLLSSKGCKDFYKPTEPCCLGIHWIALTEFSQMSTHLPGFLLYFSFFASFCLAKLATKIRGNQMKGLRHTHVRKLPVSGRPACNNRLSYRGWYGCVVAAIEHVSHKWHCLCTIACAGGITLCRRLCLSCCVAHCGGNAPLMSLLKEAACKCYE